MLKEKPITKISIQEICGRAGINRSTFYAHYEDIYDLLRKISQGHYAELDLAHQAYLRKHPEEKGKLHLEFFLRFVAEHREFYQFCMQLRYSEEKLDWIYHTVWKEYLQNQNPEWSTLPDSVMEYHFSYFWGGFMAVIKRWINGGCLESPAEIARIVRCHIEEQNPRKACSRVQSEP